MTDTEDIIKEYAVQFQALFDSLMQNPIAEEEEKLTMLMRFARYSIRHVTAKRNKIAYDDLADCHILVVTSELLNEIKDKHPLHEEYVIKQP